MGIFTQALVRAADSVTAARRVPAIGGTQARAVASVRQLRHVPVANAQMLRSWSMAPIPRAVIDFYSGKISRAQWDIVPYRQDGPQPDQGVVRRIREIMEQPSPAYASTGAYLTAVTEDLMVLDAGVVEKERMLNGEIAYLWADKGGENFKVDRFWDGDPKTPRYYFEPDPTTSIPLRNDDIIYHKMHERPNSPVGISYLEVAKTTIDALLNASRYNAKMVTQAVPDGIMDLGEGLRDNQVDEFKAYMESEVLGQKAMAYIGGSKGAQFIRFNEKNRDMQYVEWLNWEVLVFCAVMQISPQDIGFSIHINKAEGEVQQDISESKGLIPVLGAVQDFITSEVCWDKGFGGRKNNIAFRFREVSERQSLAKAQTHKLTLAGMPSQTVNEARADIGLPPIGDPREESNPFNMLMANTPLGLVLLDKVPSAYDLAMAKAKPEPKQEALTDGR